MQIFNVWIEGYSTTGMYSPARFLGSIKSDTFPNACKQFCTKEEWDKYIKSPKPNNLKSYGCRFYDNEIDARKSFG